MLRDSSSSRPQRLIITILGDHYHRGPIATSALLRVMREFDVSGEVVRTTLSRLVSKGILHRTKKGRETFYTLTVTGVALMKEGAERILSFGQERHWDGKWTVVVFSVAEKQRDRRHLLKAELRAIGFAPLFDGMWLAAFATAEQAESSIRVANVDNAIVMRAEILPVVGGVNTVVSSWELEPLRSEYERFISKFEPFRRRLDADQVSPAEALVAATQLTDDWRVFPRVDPELPMELLAADWPRSRARDLFHYCVEKARPMADLRYATLLGEAVHP